MSEYIRVLFVEAGIPARVAVVSRRTEALKDLLGGNIKMVQYWKDGSVILRNPDIHLSLHTLNRVVAEGRAVYDLIAGPFLVVAPGETGTFVSLSEELCCKYLLKFAIPDHFREVDGRIEVRHAEPQGPISEE